jgi:hypothetical protein
MAARTDTGARRAADAAVSAAFVGWIALIPCLTFLVERPPQDVEREFRRPAPWPDAPRGLDELREWPARFEAWYRDHFALRAPLIRAHNLAKMELFAVSPTSEIVLGPDHWMFTTRDRAVDVFRGADPFTEEELELWVEVLEDRRAWCAERGIEYVFAIAPNKETVYPERFPARFDVVGPTRREQLVEFVRARSDFPLLDLTGALRRAREDFAPRPVYFPLGTHWNDRGALYAYLALLERVAELVPGVRARARDDFRLVPTDFQDDSWAGRLYVEDRLVQENVELDFEREIPREFWERKREERAFVIDTELPGRSLPRAVVFHDSMGEKLRPLLAEHFSRAAFRWVSDFDTALIEQERPDVVIQLFVERALAAFSLSTSPLDTQERCAREFEASSEVLYEGFSGVDAQLDRPVDVVREPDGTLRVRYGGGGLLLPELDVPDGTWPVLRIELESPADTSLLVEFLTERFRDYSRLARGVQKPVRAGRDVVYVKLRVPELAGRLRLHPGLAAGDYVVRGLEVRAVPR